LQAAEAALHFGEKIYINSKPLLPTADTLQHRRWIWGRSLFSPIFANFRQFSPIFANFRQFSPIFANFRQFSPIFANFRQFSPIFANFRQFSAQKGVFSKKKTMS
jgi:hypothetical protein